MACSCRVIRHTCTEVSCYEGSLLENFSSFHKCNFLEMANAFTKYDLPKFSSYSHNSRPAHSFLWYAHPLKTFRYIIWRNYKGFFIKVLIFCLLVLLIAFFVYNIPVSEAQFSAIQVFKCITKKSFH